MPHKTVRFTGQGLGMAVYLGQGSITVMRPVNRDWGWARGWRQQAAAGRKRR